MKKSEIKLHPALLLFVLTIVIMVISSVGSILNLETAYYNVNPVSGELETQIVTINNLFNRTGIQYLVSNMLPNFINFAPLGTLILGLMGVGVAYHSGFLNSFFKIVVKDKPKKLFTFLVVLLGVVSSMFFEVGYVILIPIAAILFMNLGRHPSSGVCAAFAGISFGYGANIVVNGLDNTLITYTQNATKILDQSYVVSLSGNIIFMIVATVLIAYLGMIVTEKYVVSKLGRYTISEEDGLDLTVEPTKREKKGVIIAVLATALLSIIIIYCIIPGLPFSGLFLNLKENTYVAQLFGNGSFFNKGAVLIFAALLAFAGFIYGIRVKTIKSSKDLMDGANYYLKSFSSLIVLIFFAAQFCLIFKETNIGAFIVASLAEILSSIKLDRSFDNIWLSNIGNYLKLSELRELVDHMDKYLNRDGDMLMAYLYETIETSRYHDGDCEIYDLERTYEALKGYDFKMKSFVGVDGIKFGGNIKDSVLVYKKK